MRRPARPALRRRKLGGGPLVLWRTRAPDAVAPLELDTLRKSLSTLEILGDRRWPAARTGDPAAAAAAAMGRIGRDGHDGTHTDIVMSNLFLVAHAGDATARLVMAHAVGRLARRRPELTALPRIARAWAQRPRAQAGRKRSGMGA